MPTTYHRYHDLQVHQPGMLMIVANFTFNGTGEPDGAEGKPFRTSGLDLDRTGVGAYTLTIPGTGAINVLAGPFYSLVDATDKLVVRPLVTTEASRTFTLQILDLETGATATDPTDGEKLQVLIFLKQRNI